VEWRRVVKILHNAIPGRVRYKVKGLYRCSKLKVRLETKLALHEGIRSVSVGTLTGNVLVIFDPLGNPRRIVALMEEIVSEYLKELPAEPGTVVQLRAPETANERPARRRAAPTPKESISAAPSALSWHTMTSSAVLKRFKASPKLGLSPRSAETSRRKYGSNVLPRAESRSGLEIFVDQFKSLPVGMLAVAAAVSVATGGVADAVAIMAVVVINAVVGYATESEAERTIHSLKSLVRPSALVCRSGREQEIPAEDVLVGDLLVLRPGVYVPADARLIEAAHLSVDESVLTGESIPAAKSSAALSTADIPLGDRANMVYAGTIVTGGQGSAVVVAIGTLTEMGKIHLLVSEAESPETPVERQLSVVGNHLVIISTVVCGLVFVLGLLRGGGFLQQLKTAISLAVAAVPEGLPAVATTTLALGVNHMRQHKVLIRNLDSVCTIGSVQTICLDKTGTLTQNRMSVVRMLYGEKLVEVKEGRFESPDGDVNPFTNDELLRILHVCVLCNETELVQENGKYALSGSPTENALVELAITAGVDVRQLRDRYPRLEVSYRSENRQFMFTNHESDSGRLFALKGSPLAVVALCSETIKDGQRVLLTEDDRDWIEKQNESMAGDALRVLGVAYSNGENGRSETGDQRYCDNGEFDGLIWLGLVAMADPIREGVKKSIRAFHSAGLETVMITGDQSATAYAVGSELGLNNGNALKILDSTDLSGADESMLKALSRDVNVFSRVSPSNKLQIVRALQAAGKVVAMTGDGINDGPALKAADVGIAMGHAGTDVAREVADVVLEEDELEMLIVALSDGRTIYNNIRKALRFLLATNMSEIMLMAAAGAVGLGFPLNAMQLLWINLVSDIFPGIALAMDPPEPDVLGQPPRDPQVPILRGDDYRNMAIDAGLMTAGSLAAYVYGIGKYGRGAAAGTLAFQSLTISQVLHALTCRSESHRIFDQEKLPPNNYLNAAVLGTLGLQAIIQFIPGLRGLLGLAPVGVADMMVIGATAVIPQLITEMRKKSVAGSDDR